MCGRTALSLSKEQIQSACSYKSKNANSYRKPQWLPEYNAGKDYTPSYNIVPTDVTPILVSSISFQNVAESERVLKPMMWGIIPPWHKGDYKAHNLSTNNCRLENIKDSKLYSPIFRNGGRCIVIAEGFYEWQTTSKLTKNKQPYYIYSPQDDGVKVDEPDTWKYIHIHKEHGWKGIKLLYMAGLYNVWQNEETIIYSYSVITMESNSTLDWLHHRMPAVLNTEEQIEAWLDVDNVGPDLALSFLKPVQLLSWHPVSSIVNNSKNKSANCNKRVEEEKNKSKQTCLNAWFKKVEKRKSLDENQSESKRMKK